MKKWTWIILALLITGTVFFISQYKFVKMPDNAMLPQYMQRETILIKKQNASDLEQKQLIAFYDPSVSDKAISKKPIKLSRLIALPGDTLLIYEKTIYVNGEQVNLNVPVFMKYRISTTPDFDKSLLTDMPHDAFNELVENIAYELHCSPKTAAEIGRLDGVTAVHLKWDMRGKASYDIFPISQYLPWNKDYYGPLVIPKKGMLAELNFRNYDLYKRIINVYEGNRSYVNSQKIYINDELAENYRFTQDYYFVINDNRDLPSDSRGFGLLPENHIIGGK
jgi:signal peptidase I